MKAGVLPCPGVAGCFTAVRALWYCPVPLGSVEVLADQRKMLSLRKNNFFSLGPDD